MTKIRQLCLVSLLLTSGIASAANVRLQVEGLSGALEKNVRAQLSTIQSDEVTPIGVFARAWMTPFAKA